MTPIEEKVKELADKLTDAIVEMQKRRTDDAVIVQSVKSYLAGLSDGLDLAEETRGDELSIADELLREMSEDIAKEECQAVIDELRGAEEDEDQDIT
jgi:hypothetical protein